MPAGSSRPAFELRCTHDLILSVIARLQKINFRVARDPVWASRLDECTSLTANYTTGHYTTGPASKTKAANEVLNPTLS